MVEQLNKIVARIVEPIMLLDKNKNETLPLFLRIIIKNQLPPEYMDTIKKTQVNFNFSRNWKVFMKWYESPYAKNAMWNVQATTIEKCFSKESKGIVNWKRLWADFNSWYKEVYSQKKEVKWSEQKRQIETLMLNQLAELNNEQFILVYLHKGKPKADSQMMNYWEAMRLKGVLEGDTNGFGGNEDMDKITVVNLKSLL